jgi:two-component system chemotaxis response regulator CheB
LSPGPGAGGVDLIIIGCSAGGPPGLQEILPTLPAGTLTSVVVAQHMPGRFTALFAERLGRRCALPVLEPRSGEPLRPGRIYIAPGGRQTTIGPAGGGPAFEVRPRAGAERYAPSADLLMASAARLFAGRLVGILMSGMGGDGVAGLRAIKAHRGTTVAESEETAAVFGMPREAIRAGLADLVLPLPEIGRLMARRCRPADCPPGGRDLYSGR